ncbi:thermonuclease family protein [Roseateles puraquae]|uniref:TNase-like domain-containing protein n=1 Tax=Roseateles puraquae TaxID=431059 RepID=A0A254N1T0_9BURK|nr:thermonuclease family protein [Roseateles puraquae]MDG0853056.1 hypothetical protein [Roseateles puraquae]OWR02175.1 hypothetical protein CDO81_20770 [Roseateles puraquae]
MRRALLLVAALAWSFNGIAQEVAGRVVGVHDGDTITLLTPDKKQLQVRLADIDAPELGQPFGQAAKRELSSLCFNQQAKVQTRAVDVYGRTVGLLSCQGRDASRLMVEHGMAWVYRTYLKRPELVPLEEAAKGSHAGLWAEAATPPWEYRKQIKAAAAASATSPTERPAQTVHTGPRGGKYVINSAGHKEYLSGHR